MILQGVDMSKELIAIRLQQSQNDTNSTELLATAATVCLYLKKKKKEIDFLKTNLIPYFHA